MTEPERCDQCGIRLAPADPNDPEDAGPRCPACVRAHGPAEPAPRQLELTLETAGEPIGNAQLARLTAVGDR